MHARVSLVVATLAGTLAALLVPAVLAEPAAADPLPPPCTCGDVQPTDQGLLGRVRSQVNELNRYSSQPEACTDVDDASGLDDKTGFLRWRSPILSQESWLDAYNATSGVAYRLECWSPESGEYGRLIDVRIFPDINAENLARLAMDEFLLGLPAPEPVLNPAGTTLVNLQTYLRVDNIPAGRLTSPAITVPGITVVVTAEAGGVEWRMGDGSAPFTCSGVGTDGVSAAPTCWHFYRRSSAGQADGQFHGTARIVWVGTYTINGVAANEEFPVPREAGFEIQVAEAQAVVVG
jgi:hypothetical protein